MVLNVQSTSEYARFVLETKCTGPPPPPRSDHWTPPPLKSDDLFREPRDIGPPPFKNPGHAPVSSLFRIFYSKMKQQS